MGMIRKHLESGRTEVLDADLSKYFDTIPHEKLLATLKERVADPRMLDLIKMWLRVPVFEDGQFKGGKKQKLGTPQGGVISPLLANIYLHLLDRTVNNTKSLFHRYGIKIVRYADDFVLMGRTLPLEVRSKLEKLLGRMGLTLNADKTHTIDAKRKSFNFLGFTVRYSRDRLGRDKSFWEAFPSKKSEKKIREKIDDYLRECGHHPAFRLSEGLNAILRGWLNYYEIPKVSYTQMAKRRLRFYLYNRLFRYYRRKSQRRSRLYGQKAFEVLTTRYGLIDPTKYSLGLNRL